MSTAQASGNSQQGLVHWAAHQLVDDWAVSAFSRLSKIYGCDFKVNALEDDNDRIRRIALFGLRVDCESDPRTLQALITALNDPDSSVRADAARHLCGMKNPEAIEPLIDAITNDDSEDVWRNAARALRGMGEQAVEVLIPILDKNSRRGSVARYQLTLMTGQDFGFRKKKWMKWWEENKDIVVLSEWKWTPKFGQLAKVDSPLRYTANLSKDWGPPLQFVGSGQEHEQRIRSMALITVTIRDVGCGCSQTRDA